MSSDEKDPADTPDDAELAVTHGDAETADTEFTDIPEGVDDGDLSVAAPETDGPSTGEETVDEAADTAAGVTDGEGVDADATDSATTDSDEADPDAAGTDEKVDGEAAGDDDEPAGDSAASSKVAVAGRRATIVTLVRAVASAALIAAIVCVGYFGYTAVRSYFWTGPTQELRDEATEVAQRGLVYSFTFDPAKMDEWRQRTGTVLTADALKSINDSVVKLKSELQTAAGKKRTLQAYAVTAAPTEVDEEHDTAKVLVFIQAAAFEDKKEIARVPMSFVVTVTKDGDSRKVSNVDALLAYDATSSTSDGATGSESSGTGATGQTGEGK